MTAIERAEKTARGRALAFIIYAALTVALLAAGLELRHSDFLHGMWLGLTGVAMLVFLPLARWVRPGSIVARLLDDESTREHRRSATATGFWAALVTAFALALATEDGMLPLAAAEVARLIATAGAAAALARFAGLELRAARD